MHSRGHRDAILQSNNNNDQTLLFRTGLELLGFIETRNRAEQDRIGQ